MWKERQFICQVEGSLSNGNERKIAEREAGWGCVRWMDRMKGIVLIAIGIDGSPLNGYLHNDDGIYTK